MEIEVSIICNTYNHGLYIKDALESFVNQQTTFLYEVLIHDDASTDNTVSIIKEYQKRYPDIIKPIFQKENKYLLGGENIVSKYQIPRAKGKYLAICEGDDFWTDNHKLQKQYDVLEKHPEIDMCAHCVEEIDGVSGEHIRFISPLSSDGLLSTKSVISGGGAFLGTSSLFYRKKIEQRPPLFRDLYKIDYTLQVSGALRGGTYYLSECMSVYRYLTPGSWTINMSKDLKKRIKHKKTMRKVLKQINIDSERKYSGVLLRLQISNILKTTILEAMLFLSSIIGIKKNEE